MQLLPTVSYESWTVVITTLALVLYGVLQERVMTRGWGPHQELFPFSSFLVLSNRLLTVLVLVAHSLCAGHSFVPVAPLRSYCLVSASNMVSTLCQYEALKYVSFVAQTLAKTAKALPVVLWGTVFGGKRYSAHQYIHAILITGGCSMFVLGGDITSGSATKDASWMSYAAGSVLLLTYLAADGWTSTQQEVLFKTHATPIREQLIYTTAFSSIYSLAAAVASRQLLPALSFLQRHPDAAAAVFTLSLASTVIQVCISTVLQRHGALMFALMMTSRQCVSVLLSTVLFGHNLGLSQWCGLAVAFSALYHQRSSSSKDGPKQTPRSRLAVSSGPKQPHAKGGMLDAVAQSSTAPAVTRSKVEYRGSQGGISSIGSTAAVAGAAADFTALNIAAAGSTNVAAAAAPTAVPSMPAVGYWRGAVQEVAHDPHLVAVADVQPVSVASSQHVLHRHHHHGPMQQHPAGAALHFPSIQALPVRNTGVMLNSQAAQYSGLNLPDITGTTGKKQSLDLRTLWSRGTGRVMVDPTTAVAMDHRDK